MSPSEANSELILSLAKLTSALLIAFAVAPFLKRPALRATFWAGVFLILPTVFLAMHGRGILNILPQPSPSERMETAPIVVSQAPAAPIVMPPTHPLSANLSNETGSQEISGDQVSQTNWVAVVFFTGLVLSLVPILISLLRIGLTPKRPANSDTMAVWESIRPEGMATVPLYVTSSPSAPFTAGLVHAAILLPESSAAWPLRRLQSTLHHEAAHIARRDILVRMAASLVRAVLWFHPLVWLAHRQLVAAQEEACDESTLAAGIPPDEYAEDLLETAKHSRFAFAHSLHMARWSQLGQRIQTILSKKQTNPQPITMKTNVTAILGIVIASSALSTLGFSEILAESKAPTDPTPAQATAKAEAEAKATVAAEASGKAAIEKKLKTIVIPSIDFKDVSIKDAIDFLRIRAAEHDTEELDRAKKGINFVVKRVPGGEPMPQINELRLKNVPLAGVLKHICELAGLRYEVDDSAVIIE